MPVLGRHLRTAGLPLETRKVLLGHKTGGITSRYSAPELAELIRAANVVLKSQESTLLRVVTKQNQGGDGEKSGKSRARIIYLRDLTLPNLRGILQGAVPRSR
jgi:hypothetical protein